MLCKQVSHKTNLQERLHSYIQVLLYTHDSIWRRRTTALLFLCFDTRCRWVVSFTPWPLYPWGNIFQHWSDKRLAGPQNCPGHFEKVSFIPQPFCPWEKNPLGIHGICGYMGHGAGVDLGIREKPLTPAGNQTPISGSSDPQPSHYIDWATM